MHRFSSEGRYKETAAKKDTTMEFQKKLEKNFGKIWNRSKKVFIFAKLSRFQGSKKRKKFIESITIDRDNRRKRRALFGKPEGE